jgi:hypothetical protein
VLIGSCHTAVWPKKVRERGRPLNLRSVDCQRNSSSLHRQTDPIPCLIQGGHPKYPGASLRIRGSQGFFSILLKPSTSLALNGRGPECEPRP